MDGDLGALPALCDARRRVRRIMMVDDAHASGVFGRNGRGTVDHFGLHGRVDIQVGTLSKAIGALGGYVAGSRALIEFLHHRGAAVPVLDVASAVGRRHLSGGDRRPRAASPSIIERLWENTRFFKAGPGDARASTPARAKARSRPSSSATGALAMTLSDRLFEEGVFAQGIAFPTVAQDRARVRTIVTATHTRDAAPVRPRRVQEGRAGARADLTVHRAAFEAGRNQDQPGAEEQVQLDMILRLWTPSR